MTASTVSLKMGKAPSGSRIPIFNATLTEIDRLKQQVIRTSPRLVLSVLVYLYFYVVLLLLNSSRISTVCCVLTLTLTLTLISRGKANVLETYTADHGKYFGTFLFAVQYVDEWRRNMHGIGE